MKFCNTTKETLARAQKIHDWLKSNGLHPKLIIEYVMGLSEYDGHVFIQIYDWIFTINNTTIDPQFDSVTNCSGDVKFNFYSDKDRKNVLRKLKGYV